ncbi:MAG: hypothetical protein QM730_11925 [Anaerolineales bacterium]
MKVKKLYYALSLVVAFSMMLAACAPAVATSTQAPAQTTQEPSMTEAPATQAPTEVPHTERHGGWLDEIDVSVVDGDFAISQIQAGAIDFYSLTWRPVPTQPSRKLAYPAHNH